MTDRNPAEGPGGEPAGGPPLRGYRLLLRLLPRDLREAWGAEMEALLARRLDEAGSPVERAGIRAGAARDVVAQAVAARVAGARREGRTDSTMATMTMTTTGGGGGMERIWQDVRYAARGLARSPGFTAVAVLTLALGVGASSAVFTVVESVLLRPLPYHEPDRLVTVWPESNNFNISMVERIEADVPALESVTGISSWEFTLVGEGEPERVGGAVVSADHFAVLGVPPALGRAFMPEEAEPDRAGVVVLAHDLWIRRFGGDPEVMGRSIRVGGYDFEARTVVGVMPEGHRPIAGEDIQLWVPLHGDSARAIAEDGSWYVNWRVGRLAPGATVEQATEQLRTAARALHPAVSHTVAEEAVRTASIAPLHEAQVGEMGTTLWLLLGAVGLVLLVACANVANLLLARGEARERDLAVRQALGAGRGRLTSWLLTESLLLGLVGGALGMLIAVRGTALLVRLAPEDFPRAAEIAVDGSVFAFTFGCALAASVLFGVAPALKASRASSADALRGGGRGSTPDRRSIGLNRWLVTAQIALAVLLATGAGLMVRSLGSLYAVDPGFETDDLLVYRLSPPDDRFESGDDLVDYYRRVIDRVESVPGVTSAAAIHLLPLTASNWLFPVYPEGFETPEGETNPSANFRVVHPGYFTTMGIGLERGRVFDGRDGPGDTRTAVVNGAFVEKFWPRDDALGMEIRLFSRDGMAFRVIGVVEDVHQHALDLEPRPELYIVHPQWNAKVAMWMTVRTAGDPMDMAPAVRAATWEVDGDVPLSGLARMSDVVGRSAGRTRFVTFLLGAFGMLALLIAAVGVYGVTSYTTARRVPELGVRMALGAPRSTVLLGSLARGLAPVAVGLVIGTGAALAAGRLVESLLFGVEPGDPATLAGVALVLGTTAVLATWVPAWRASRVDPARALREE